MVSTFHIDYPPYHLPRLLPARRTRNPISSLLQLTPNRTVEKQVMDQIPPRLAHIATLLRHLYGEEIPLQ